MSRFTLVGYNGFAGKAARSGRPQNQPNFFRFQVLQQFGALWHIARGKFKHACIPFLHGGRRVAA
jgi:hypothetical protein